MKKLIVITDKTAGRSDLETILGRLPGVEVETVGMREAGAELAGADALAVIGGKTELPEILPAPLRARVEAFIASGKPVFAEYISSIADVYFGDPESTRFCRMLFFGTAEIEGLEAGEILEDQCNSLLPSYFAPKNAKPLLVSKKYIKELTKSEVTQSDLEDARNRALWFHGDNLLVCTFRICNYARSRFSPAGRWNALVGFIAKWLTGAKPEMGVIPPAYELSEAADDGTLGARVEQAVIKASDWAERADMLVDEGRLGILEGFGTEIYPDGSQRVSRQVRNDCTGEAALLYAMRYMLDGDERYLKISDNLLDYCFDFLQVKEAGLYCGMQRWTENAWGVCYADDCARVLLALLFKNLFLGSRAHMDECVMSCDFLIGTTGTDGLRVWRTDMIALGPDEAEKLRSTPSNFPSAHYNAYYLGALALTYRLTGHRRFLEVAQKGLEAMMAVYPDMLREISETEAMSRLVLPLALLFWATGEAKHKEFLYRVAEDLQRFRHKTGAYMEWDTGYKANLNMTEGGECSLLTKNGDPVADLLYSLNWLPQGFIVAYFATGDDMFYDLWRGISRFMCTAQVKSDNPAIDGAWARGYDLERLEIAGLPNDIGWGPWAIESGWTVGEIGAGLAMGLLKDKLAPLFG